MYGWNKSLSHFSRNIYGSPIWGLPDTSNYLTLYGTNNPQQGRLIINMITDKIIPTVWVRNTTSTRHPSVGVKVLLNVDNFGDKELILMTRHNLPDGYSIHDVDLEIDSYAYEKVNTNFCRFILNLSKQAGYNACRGVTGRFPTWNKIWNLSAKYWLRLEQGTYNLFLSNAFLCAKTENHNGFNKCAVLWPGLVWATYGPILHHIHQHMLVGHWNNVWMTHIYRLGKWLSQNLVGLSYKLPHKRITKWAHIYKLWWIFNLGKLLID